MPNPGNAELAPLQFEPRLVEEAVRVALEQGASGVTAAALMRVRCTHRRRLDEIYEQAPGGARETAFREHYRWLFGVLSLDRRVEECLQRFPTLRLKLHEVLVRSLIPPEKESAELWESRRERGRGIPAYLVVSLAPAHFSCSAEMAESLLPRLRRAADLLASLGGGDDGSRAQLLPLAEKPVGSAAEETGPASRCPLCAFPTMVWASPESLAGAREATIRADFPAWRPADGCCEHCADRYAGLAALAR